MCLQKLESSSKESVDFMETEHAALREELLETTHTLTDNKTQLQQAR